MVHEIFALALDTKTTANECQTLGYDKDHRRNVRCSVFCCVLGVSIERLPTMGRRNLFENGEKAGNTDYSTHDIVHESRIDDHIGPVVTVLSRNVSRNVSLLAGS